MFANKDVREFVECLIKHEVRFVLVGGYAVMYYTEPRYTKDIDFFVEATVDNSDRILKVLDEFGVPPGQVSEDLFKKEGNFFKIGRPPWRIDLMTSIEGVDFTELYANSLEVEVDGIPIKVVAKEDLIEIKKKANRPQDQIDLASLEKAK